MGKFIVIDGLDGSGKSTQLELLYNRLLNDKVNCRSVSFPNYGTPACASVEMYLNGEFGQSVNSVNSYAASMFYAVDRYASYKTDWGKYYDKGGLILSGRYVTSNAIHQCSKLPENEWQDFCDWLYDFEYKKIGIPSPDCVIFLSMPDDISDKLLLKRYNGDEQKKDIHEKDRDYQQKCRKAAQFAAKHGNWNVIDCTENGELRSVEDISNQIYSMVKKII